MGWDVDTLKEYFESELRSLRRETEAIKANTSLARTEMERRLGELNQLRGEVTQDREQFVRREVYDPSHKEVVKELNEVADKLIEITAGQATNREAINTLKNTLGWLTRLIIGAVILALIAFGFRALTGR